MSTIKRSLDLVFAVVGLVLTAPLLLATAALVWWVMGSPVLFRQKRGGLGGAIFDLYKFRTMKAGSGADHERLTRLGCLLRAASIDELPQLWNVLRGEMSLVGPRPLIAEYLPLYNKRQMRRHEVRPGITGWTQVCGRNSLSWHQKFELDLWYVDHESAELDLKILLLTFWRLIRPRGIHQAGHATTEPFRGNRAEGSLTNA